MATTQPKSDTSPSSMDASVRKQDRLLAYLKERAAEIRGNPAALLAATDEFCYKTRMMHVGDKKGAIVRKVVQELAPMTCLELGTFCGYSAVLMASALPEGSRFITLEADETHAAVAKEFIELAGAQVSDKVTLVVKKSEDVIPNLRKDFSVDTLDFVFIDHWKELYVRDLKLLESHGLLRKGTVILADNMIYPGAPDYLEYVQNSEKYQTELFHSTLEYSDREDAVAKSIYSG
ncbi:catechol O-methyltransferase-like [Patiria miniata]|uniref:catechol O-methyltransferase n=1 Tax=Patiria miniata TaxID=46514 RepID=A0A913ZXA5_PATMI|nr:catechol O-methyltransferase-like [Patiria miniata]XP_038056181.1 catechol O-methyltransferase-like [Patiria miniata]XP_038056182.1 catechol O-methyltransferase-like [Patiria miniata]